MEFDLIKSKYIDVHMAKNYINDEKCDCKKSEAISQFLKGIEFIISESNNTKPYNVYTGILLYGYFVIRQLYYPNKTKREVKNIFKELLAKNYQAAYEKHKEFPTDKEALYFLFLEEVLEYAKAYNDKEGEEREIAELIDIATLCVRCIDNIVGAE